MEALPEGGGHTPGVSGLTAQTLLFYCWLSSALSQFPSVALLSSQAAVSFTTNTPKPFVYTKRFSLLRLQALCWHSFSIFYFLPCALSFLLSNPISRIAQSLCAEVGAAYIKAVSTATLITWDFWEIRAVFGSENNLTLIKESTFS